MLIASTKPILLSSTQVPTIGLTQTTPPTPIDSLAPSPSAEENTGQIKWGPVLGLVSGFGAGTGLAASGLGWVSAVPAFLVGGVTGFVLVQEGIMSAIGGKDNSGAGAVASMAGIAGGLAAGVGATALALSYGSPMIGLGAGIGAAALALGGGLYLGNR